MKNTHNRKTLLAGITFIAASMVSGCGDSGPSTPASTTTLTTSQATAVSSVIGGAANQVGSPTTSLSALRDKAQSSSSDQTQCEDGNGTITYSEGTEQEPTFNQSTGRVSGSFSSTEVYDDCQVSDGSSTFVLNGTLNNEGNVDMTVTGLPNLTQTTGNISVDGTISTATTGTLAVSGTGVTAGDCGVGITYTFDLSLDSNGNSATFSFDNISSSGTYEGTICDTVVTGSKS